MTEPTLGTVLQAIGDMRTELSGMRTELSGRIDHLDGRMDRIEGRMDRLEHGQTRLRVDLSERMDRLQTGLTALRQGYVVDWTHVDRAKRIADNAFDETRSLADQMMQLTKLVHLLEKQISDLRGAG